MVVPRAAARWADGRLTVWASTQNAQLTRGYREHLARVAVARALAESHARS
jgi:hypothetical protein